MAFLKTASLKIENPEVTIKSWIGNQSNVKTASDSIINFRKIISDFDPKDYLLTHCTIVASVDVEDGPKEVHFVSDKTKKELEKLTGIKQFYITPETSKYVNSNGDAWARDLLKASYKSFIGAENYLEHNQDPDFSKGKILDAAIREVDNGRSLFVDILVATDIKHKDLVAKIKTGELTTLSMGAKVAFTICTECGRVASDETETCTHIRYFKRNSFISENDGKKRVIAELCGHVLYPESNEFIEGSWVENPAFKGAVKRNELEIADIDKEAFIEKYEPIMNIKSADLRETASRILAAFNLVDKVKQTFKTSKTEIPPEDIPAEIPPPEPGTEDAPPEEMPVEDTTSPIEDAPETDTPVTEDAPLDAPPADIPPELTEMGQPPIDTTMSPEIEEEAKKPYDMVKEDIKENLKDQIKQELLTELGVEIKKPTPSTLNNLNDTLVNSSVFKNLDKIKKANSIISKEGLKSLFKHGYSKEEILKLAFLLKKYSINKDIYQAANVLDSKDFISFRRFAKAVEQKISRELTILEKNELAKLVKDLWI